MLTALLQRRQFVEDYCPVSTRFAWLLQPAMTLTEEIVQQNTEGPFYEALLDIVAASTSAEYLHMYTGDTQKKALSLLDKNRALKNALFWRLVEQRRITSQEELNDFWNLRLRVNLNWFDLADAQYFLDSIRSRARQEDRLLSLSVLVNMCRSNGAPQDLLEKIRGAAEGDSALRAALDEYLTPKELPPYYLEAERERERFMQENKERERARQDDRAKWVNELKGNPALVGNLEQAEAGTVLNSSVWLMDELRKKAGSNSSWSISDWSPLIPEFGADVAAAFRNYCMAIWRRYTPRLRSDGNVQENNTPWIVVLGLSGLAMEAGMSPAWTEKLTPEEASLATRYAIWELNGFPTWLEPLWRKYPESVKSVLLHEISWELSRSGSEGKAGYILSRLRWSTERSSGRVPRGFDGAAARKYSPSAGCPF